MTNTLPDLNPETLADEPLARASTIPSSWYVDPAFHPFDLNNVFARTWQFVGHVGQIAEPGDYLSTEVAANPVIVVRDDDQIRAFYNVCRHRGGPLAIEPRGHVRMLQCKYHGWTYRLDGTLRGVPRFDRTELFDKKDFGLVELAIQQWEGLLFVSIDDPPVAVSNTLEGVRDAIAPFSIGELKHTRTVRYEVACNWKVYVDNYLEGYHLPLVHPELCNVLDYRSYKTEVHEHYSLQRSPLDDDEGEAFYYFVFPNLMLNILPGRLQTNVVRPISHDRTEVVFDYFYGETDTPAAVEAIERDIHFSDRVQQEDIEICEQVQKGLASRGYDRGRFSVDEEAAVHHFQQLLRSTYRNGLESSSSDC